MNLYRKPNKYLIIYESLLNFIRQQNPKGEQYLPSERELVGTYKVDRHTIRKALDMLAREGYIRKEAGKGSIIVPFPISQKDKGRTDTTNTIAFILPQGRYSVDRITEPFNTNLFYLIEKELSFHGCHLTYATVTIDGGIPDTLLQMGIKGIIFVSQVPERSLADAERYKLPTVLINRISNVFPMVLEDRYQGFTWVLEHLVELGHTNLLYINGLEGHYTTEACKKAFFDFLIAKSDQKVMGNMLSCYWDYESGKTVMKDYLLHNHSIPTAVCGCNDMVAIGAMDAAKELGFRIPEDMSFMGFDNTEQSKLSHPKLSTIDVNSEIIAKYAVEVLFAFISKGNPGPLKIIIPTSLVVRESTHKRREDHHE